MKITYSSNNSGGHWWLKDKDWKNLERAGWDVEWEKEGRFLGALPHRASKDFASVEEAISEWESVVGQSATEEGCPCCGPPHEFYDW